MAESGQVSLKQTFYAANRECNIGALFRQHKLGLDEDTLQALVDGFLLSTQSINVPVKVNHRTADWNEFERSAVGDIAARLTEENEAYKEKGRNGFQTKPELLGYEVARELVRQLRAADDSRGIYYIYNVDLLHGMIFSDRNNVDNTNNTTTSRCNTNNNISNNNNNNNNNNNIIIINKSNKNINIDCDND